MEINTTATDLELYYSDKDQVYLTKTFVSLVEANYPAINLVTVNNFFAERFKKDIIIYYKDIERVNGVPPSSYNDVVLLLRNFLGA